MEFEFDPYKDQQNRFKHGVSLDQTELIFADPHVMVSETNRVTDGEMRFKAVGHFNRKLYTVVFV
jgi:uncharacterized protein